MGTYSWSHPFATSWSLTSRVKFSTVVPRHKLMPRQSTLLWNLFRHAEGDWCQSHRDIDRAVSPWCAMHGNDCPETWKRELVRAQIDHRSLFLLKTQWQQSWDVFFCHRVLQHTRASVDHSGHLVGGAAPPTPCGVIILQCTCTPRRPTSLNFGSPSDTWGFSNQRLTCCAVHYQVSRRDIPGDPVADAASSSDWPHQVAALQTDSSSTVCGNVNPEKTAGAVPSLLCCFSGHFFPQQMNYEVSTHSKSRPQRVQKTVNDKRPHANMLRAGRFTLL